MTGDRRNVGWDEGMRTFNMPVEERIDLAERGLERATWSDVPMLAQR